MNREKTPSLLETMYCGSRIYYHEPTNRLYELVGNRLVPYCSENKKEVTK